MSDVDAGHQALGLSARATAYHRALESERDDRLFHDELARRLAGSDPRELAQLEEVPAFGARNAWSTAVRTVAFDELLLGVLDQAAPDLILSLGAGLDTRPYRLSLPPGLRWVEVDLPQVLAHKEERLAGIQAGCELERLALDLTRSEARTRLVRRVGAGTENALVLTEGVLIYLEEEDVARLGRELQEVGSYRWWLTDVATPPVLRTARRRGLHGGFDPEIRFRFAPREGIEFFEPLGWTSRESRAFVDEAIRLDRLPGPAWLYRWILNLVPGLRRRYRSLASIVLLGREGVAREGVAEASCKPEADR